VARTAHAVHFIIPLEKRPAQHSFAMVRSLSHWTKTLSFPSGLKLSSNKHNITVEEAHNESNAAASSSADDSFDTALYANLSSGVSSGDACTSSGRSSTSPDPNYPYMAPVVSHEIRVSFLVLLTNILKID
jgi:hypothetical protein